MITPRSPKEAALTAILEVDHERRGGLGRRAAIRRVARRHKIDPAKLGTLYKLQRER